MNLDGWRPSDIVDVLTLIGSFVLILIGWTTKKYVDGRMSELVDLIRQLTGVRDRRGRGERRRPAVVVRARRAAPRKGGRRAA